MSFLQVVVRPVGRFRAFAGSFLVAAMLTAGAATFAADPATPEWPQLLGPARNGISTETGLLEKWPDGGPTQVWKIEGGVGMSGLAISRGRLVTLVQKDGKQWLFARDAKTGEPAWQTALAPEYKNSQGDGPRATPTIAGDRVFAFTGEGILAACRFDNGELLWSHDVVKDNGGRVADYGMACSPLVVGDRVIVTAGAPKATVVALDADSGETAWTAGQDVAGYSSPALFAKLAGRPQVVVFTGASVLGLDPSDGTELWRYPYETNYECNIVTPLLVDGNVFVSSGENHGSALLSLKPAGSKFEVTPVWESQGVRSVLRNEWQTSILLDGHLYGFDNVGGAGPVTHLTCIDAATGQRVWQQPRFGKGNMIAADGKLWSSTINGELVVLRVNPKAYEEIGRAEVLGFTRQAPALCGGLLYLRDDQHIICLDVRK